MLLFFSTLPLSYATNSTGSWRVVLIDAATLDVYGATDTAIAADPQGNVHISYVRDGDIRYATNR